MFIYDFVNVNLLNYRRRQLMMMMMMMMMMNDITKNI